MPLLLFHLVFCKIFHRCEEQEIMVKASKRKCFTLRESTNVSNTSYSQGGVSLLGGVDSLAVWLYDCHC